MAKVETRDGVTVTTYEDGSQKVETPGSTVRADQISGGVHFHRH